MEPFRIQLLVVSFFDVPAFCFHLSMLVFIIVQIIKKATLFRQGFYYMYAVVSVVDLYYITMVSRECWNAFESGRNRKNILLPLSSRT